MVLGEMVLGDMDIHRLGPTFIFSKIWKSWLKINILKRNLVRCIALIDMNSHTNNEIIPTKKGFFRFWNGVFAIFGQKIDFLFLGFKMFVRVH
jgi:hypothetical protein